VGFQNPRRALLIVRATVGENRHDASPGLKHLFGSLKHLGFIGEGMLQPSAESESCTVLFSSQIQLRGAFLPNEYIDVLARIAGAGQGVQHRLKIMAGRKERRHGISWLVGITSCMGVRVDS
jgi:hypothetical protein